MHDSTIIFVKIVFVHSNFALGSAVVVVVFTRDSVVCTVRPIVNAYMSLTKLLPDCIVMMNINMCTAR